MLNRIILIILVLIPHTAAIANDNAPILPGEFKDRSVTPTSELLEDGKSQIITTPDLPDVIVTELSYADGIFTSTVKNQGNAATPDDVAIAVRYSVNGKYKTWGGIQSPLAAGASVTIGTNGAPYVIPNGTHTITAWVDDVDRFEELNENNNQLSQSITVSGSGGTDTQ